MVFRVTTNFNIGLSDVELAQLKTMLDSGDRAGFYIAYHAMTGSQETLLTSKIATFSETTGGTAFVANWLLQQKYQPGSDGIDPPSGDARYKGIYQLSQDVALQTYTAIKNDAENEDYDVETGPDLLHDGIADGIASDQRLFNTAFNAWDIANNERMWPGNILVYLENTASLANLLGNGQGELENPEALPRSEALTSAGFKASAQAMFFAQDFGKQESDFASTISGPDGIKLAVDSEGRVQGVFDPENQADANASLASLAASFREALRQALETSTAEQILNDPGGLLVGTAVFAATEVLGVAAFGLDAWQVVRIAWLEAALDEDKTKAGLLGMSNYETATDAEIETFLNSVNESDVRRGFTEFNNGYNGDTAPKNSGLETPSLTWKATASGNDDVIALNEGGQLDGLAGDDLLFGSKDDSLIFAANDDDTLIGGAGNDVIWGRSGDDKLYGDDMAGSLVGNDILRGGEGDDQLFGGKGDDFIDGGDITSARFEKGLISLFDTNPDGFDILDYTKLTNSGTIAAVDISVRIDSVNSANFEGVLDNLGGTAGVVTKGTSGGLGTDVFHSIERIELGAADNIINHGTSTEAENRLDGGQVHAFNFNLEDATEAFTQSILIERTGDEIVSDATLFVDGHQLVGGAAFDFNKFEVRTQDFLTFSPLLQPRSYGPVLTLDAFEKGRLSSVAELFAKASIAATATAATPLFGTSGISIGLGLLFGNLAILDAMNWDRNYVDAYEQVILGWHGERYYLGTEKSDGSRDVQIVLDDEDVSAQQIINLENWKQGDFGIQIEELEVNQGLETGTNKNSIYDSWQDFSDENIQQQLRTLGFNLSPTEPSGTSNSEQPPTNRQGNEGNNAIAGGSNDDAFRGGEGDDQLIGKDGFDTYIFAEGDGADTIVDASPEGGRVQFQDGVDLSAVTQVEVSDGNGGQNLLVTYGSGDTITIVGWSSFTQETKDAWVFEVLDGPSISFADIALTPDISIRPTELTGTSGADEIEGTDVSEIITGLAGADILRGNGGDDQILAGSGNNNVSGGDGNDRIVTGSDDDIIRGGRGNDNIDGGTGDDIYHFDLGDGADTIRDRDGGSAFFNPTDTNRIVFGEGITADDIRIVRDIDASSALTLLIGDDGDQIRISDQYSVASRGFDGIEEFEFQDGTLWTRQDVEEIYKSSSETSEDDVIVGFDHLDDVLSGGIGNDTISGGEGSDTYHWNRGDGNDLIIDTSSSEGDRDVLKFGPNVLASDVSAAIVRAPSGQFVGTLDLVLTISGVNGGQLTVKEFFQESSEPFNKGVELISFFDGTVWDREAVFNLVLQDVATSGNDIINGTPGSDAINGGDGDDQIEAQLGDDIIIGGGGNDRLIGGGGSDTYVFGASFGQDTLYDSTGNADRIIFTEYTVSDFTFRSINPPTGSLIIERIGSDDSLIINHFGTSQNPEIIEFSDGLEITWDTVLELAEISVFAPNSTNGTLNADVLDGSNLGDRFFGLDGDDQLSLGSGNDIAYGGAGNDTLSGGDGRDALLGDSGNDNINAGDGNDIVLGGAGLDVLSGDGGDDFLDGGDQNDNLSGGLGDDVLVGGLGDDTLLGDDGNDVLTGGVGNDILSGGAGNDTLYGSSGDDVYRFERGDGQDTIISADGRDNGDIKTLELGDGLTQDNIRFNVSGVFFGSPDLIISFANGTTDSIRIDNFTKGGVLDRIIFADGSEMNASQILEQVTGATGGNDNPAPSFDKDGFGTSHITYGGRGDDVLNSGGGRDLFVFGRGDGNDVINIEGGLAGASDSTKLHLRDYTPSETTLSRTGSGRNDLTITFNGSDDSIVVSRHFGGSALFIEGALDEIVFQDGTVWSKSVISNKVIESQASDGDDLIVGESEVSSNELLDGGLGDDSLSGGTGSDTYVYNLGDGNDTVLDTVSNGSDVDRIVLGLGLNPDNVTVQISQTDPENIILLMPDGGQIVIVNQLANDARGIEEIIFPNGSVWSRTDIASEALNSMVTDGDDTLQGSNAAEILDGGLGDDVLSGGNGGDTYRYSLGDGNDQIIEGSGSGVDRLLFDNSISPEDVTFVRDVTNSNNLLLVLSDGATITLQNQFSLGNGIELISFSDGTRWNRETIQEKTLEGSTSDGADVLIGTVGDDVIFGAEGNDVLDGGAGADLYIFRIGDGQDTLQDSGGVVGVDRLALGEGIDPSMVDLARIGDNLVLSLRDLTDGITIVDYFLDGQATIGSIEFLDGSIWDATDILSRATNQAPIVVSNISSQTVAQNASFAFSVPTDTFNDADVGDSFVLTAELSDGSALPEWLTFDGSIFSGSPANSDVGSVSVRVTATDASGDRQNVDFTLEVTNVNDAPVVSELLPNQAVSIGSPLTYTISEGVFVDPDAAILGNAQPDLTYSAELADGSLLPSWLSFDEVTRTFSGTPPIGADGALNVRVIASDGQASGSALLGIAVGEGNTAPTVLTAIGLQQANEELAFVFTVPEDAFADSTVGDRLIYSATLEGGNSLPEWLSFDARSGLLAGTPSNDDVGVLSIAITATDIYGASATSLFALNIANVNDAPTREGELESFLAREEELFDQTIPTDFFQDIDQGDTLVLTAQLIDGQPLPSWLTFENGRFSGTPDDPDVNIHNIVVTATDTTGASTSANFFLFVEPVNDAPEVVSELQTISVNRNEEFTYDLPSDVFQDVDDLGMSFSVSSANNDDLPSWLTFDPITRQFSGEPDFSSVGTNEGARDYQIRVTATDASGASVNTTLTITVQSPFPGETLIGTNGDDVINGSAGPDRIEGGTGNDQLYGREGIDTFVFAPGFGQDTLSYANPSGNNGNSYLFDFGNRIVFEDGISADDIILSRSGSTTIFREAETYLSDLVINIAGSTDQITVEGQFSRLIGQRATVTEIEFSDGTVWDENFILNQLLLPTSGDDTLVGDRQNNIINGGAGNDTVFGLYGNDILNGGAGDDILFGARDNDTYVFEIGTGNDLIIDEASGLTYSFDTLQFGSGISAEDLTFTRDYLDPRVPGDYSLENTNNLRIEYAPTGDSVVILYQYNFQGDRTGGIEQFEFANGSILSLQEFDRLVSPDGLREGTENADNIQGTSLSETFDGQQGNDVINGGLGDDVYRWSLGDGNDSIREFDITSFDAIEFGPNINPSDVALSREVNPTGDQVFDLYLDILPTGERITIESAFASDVSSTGEFEKPIDEIRFSDGSIWSFSFIVNSFLQGTDGNDSLRGFDPLPDLLDGGAGNDELRGLGGSDTYVFGRGYDVDTVFDAQGSFFFNYPVDARDYVRFNEGILPSDIELSRSIELDSDGELQTFTNLTIAGTADTLRLSGNAGYILELYFRETDTRWSLDQLKENYLSQNNTDGNDLLIGFGDQRVINGGAGDDRLVNHHQDLFQPPRPGGDSYIGGAGNDTYEVGVLGNTPSIIADRGLVSDFDILFFNQDFSTDPEDLSFRRAANGQDLYVSSLRLHDFFKGAEYTIEEIRFSDGTILTMAEILSRVTPDQSELNLITGTANSETLAGLSSLGETINGGAGDDILIGGDSRSDVYLWKIGDGNDTIIEGNSNGSQFSFDVLKFDDVNLVDIDLIRNGLDLQVRINTSDEVITIQGQFGPVSNGRIGGIEEIVFADNEILRRAEIMSQALLEGTDNDDTISGTNDDDRFLGGLGDDQINATLGDDTFVYRLGDGSDTINDIGNSNDTLEFTDINNVDVSLSRVGNDLTILIISTGDVITINNHFIGGLRGIEQIVFADSTIWDQNQIAEEAWIRGTSGDDTLTGSNDDETLSGGTGNDLLSADDGSDDYVFNLGDGQDVISEVTNGSNSDVDRIVFGENIAPSDVVLTRANNGLDLVFNINGTTDTLTVSNQFVSKTSGVERVVFTDGTIWSRDQIVSFSNLATEGDDTLIGDETDNVLNGAAGNDIINGLSGQDMITGGLGDDTLAGGNDADSYFYSRGDGNDIINDGGADGEVLDRLIFASDILPEDITVTRSEDGQDFILQIIDTGETITLQNRLISATAGVDEVIFSDGTLWDFISLERLAVSNQAPIAIDDDAISLNEDTSITIAASDLLANDSDVDGDALTITSVASALNGTVLLDGNGDVVFTPAATFNGPASFTYTISDGNGGSDTATVNLTVNAVNNAPIVAIAIADQTSAEDTAWNYAVPANTFSDVDGDTLILSATLADDTVLPGWITFDAGSQTFSGTPPANFNGSLNLKVTASDTLLQVSDEFTVTINPINDAPVASDDGVIAIEENTDTIFSASSLLANDSDVEGDTLSILSVENAVNGSVVLSADNSVIFSPSANYNGSASFSYTISDGNGGTNSATVMLLISAVNLIQDIAGQTQYVTGTSGFDAFVIDGNSTDYQWSETVDGTGIVVFSGADFDVLTDVEQIRFNNGFVTQALDGTLSFSPNNNTINLVQDVAGVTQFITGAAGTDAFVIDGNSTDYGWGDTADGTGIVVFSGADFDVLTDFEQIHFNNGIVEQAEDGTFSFTPNNDTINLVQDEAGVTQFITGTPGTDAFVIDGNSTNYGWGETADGTGIVVFSGADFDVLTDFEQIHFNDGIVEQAEDGTFSFVSNEQAPSGLNVISNDPVQNENITGTDRPDIFTIDSLSTEFAWGETVDSEGIVVYSGADFDILNNVEQIQFNDGVVTQLANDSFVFAANSEILTVDGDANNNTLVGGNANDTLSGLGGDDVLTGGSGLDLFIATQTNGNDIINDFEDGYDLIDFSSLTGTVDSISDLTLTQVGADAVISFSDGSFTLSNIQSDTLTFNDFIFS